MTNPNTAPDTALVALIPKLKPLARHLGRDPTDAEDLLQDALIAMLVRLRSGGEIDSLPAYGRIVLKNTARRRRFPPITEVLEEDSPHAARPSVESAYAAMEALTHLPEAQARLVRAALEGHSTADLAQREGIPPGTVHSRLARARAQLRAELAME